MDPKMMIAPLQTWLLSQGRCVGCGRPLKGGKKKPVNGVIQVSCHCERIFIYTPEDDSYRRALFNEISA